jgi:hypothetical protein
MKKQNKEGKHSLMDLSLCANPEAVSSPKPNGASFGYPASVLAPGSALGLLPSSALSSVQVGPHCSRSQRRSKRSIETFVDLITRGGVENLVPHVISIGRF